MPTSISSLEPDLDLIHSIQRGFSYSYVDSIIEKNTLTHQELSQFISLRTLARRKKERRLTPDESDCLAMIEHITFFATETFGNVDKAHRWLRTPNHALEGQKPLDLLHSQSGTRLVEAILGRIQHGIYS